jgi:hypothetical protein
VNKSVGGAGLNDIAAYSAQCRSLRDTRDLHSGEWFMRQGRAEALRATVSIFLHLASVVGGVAIYWGFFR